MNLNTKAIFTTENNIKDSLVDKLNLKKEETTGYEVYTGVRESEENLENIVLVYSSINNFVNAINFVKENYILQKIILLGFSKILRNQDMEAGDIIIPNTFLDANGENPIFLDYAIGENYDLNIFGLILNGVLYDMGVEKTHCGSNCNCSSGEDINNEEFSGDVKDMASYKFLKFLLEDDLELTTVIRCCIADSDDRNNQFFVDNLVNISEIML